MTRENDDADKSRDTTGLDGIGKLTADVQVGEVQDGRLSLDVHNSGGPHVYVALELELGAFHGEILLPTEQAADILTNFEETLAAAERAKAENLASMEGTDGC